MSHDDRRRRPGRRAPAVSDKPKTRNPSRSMTPSRFTDNFQPVRPTMLMSSSS